jgi:bifunctional non-homologous end joining protein LigD
MSHCRGSDAPYISDMLRKIPFITPMAPTLTKEPPTGGGWLHEIKFDGFRAQVHVEGGDITIYSRNGDDLTRRFRRLKSTVASIRVESAIIDCELVACDESGQPDFRALMSNKRDCDLCLWCFDLLALDGERLTEKPLVKRRSLLNELVNVADDHAIQFSMAFDGDADLLAAAERMGLAGIVSKRKDSFYRSGPTRVWLKAKTATWRASNSDRWELFDGRW